MSENIHSSSPDSSPATLAGLTVHPPARPRAWIVTLDAKGNSPRPKFGAFLWNPKYGRYVWRGELAQTMGQLAELFTQAATFLRSQNNYYLVLSAEEVETNPKSQVPNPNGDGEEDSALGNPQSALEAETSDWQSEKAAANAQLLEVISKLEARGAKLPPTRKKQPAAPVAATAGS